MQTRQRRAAWLICASLYAKTTKMKSWQRIWILEWLGGGGQRGLSAEIIFAERIWGKLAASTVVCTKVHRRAVAISHRPFFPPSLVSPSLVFQMLCLSPGAGLVRKKGTADAEKSAAGGSEADNWPLHPPYETILVKQKFSKSNSKMSHAAQISHQN